MEATDGGCFGIAQDGRQMSWAAGGTSRVSPLGASWEESALPVETTGAEKRRGLRTAEALREAGGGRGVRQAWVSGLLEIHGRKALPAAAETPVPESWRDYGGLSKRSSPPALLSWYAVCHLQSATL